MGARSPNAALLTLAAMLLAAPPAGAQLRDSARVLRDARRAQATFEQVRRANLPWRESGLSYRPEDCSVIGRFIACDEGDGAYPDPPPESRRILDARSRLVSSLDSAARRLPGDRWISGQRVRYLLEAGRLAEAHAAAAECRAEPWWCAALDGLAYHVEERYASADSAFALAL